MKFNEGVSQADFDTILRIAKKIGVETGADLQRFKREVVKDGESVVDAFLRYEKELGDDFKLEEALDEEGDWVYVASKEVEDSDGFMTEYTWYKRPGEDGNDIHIMMFGDSELYEPDEAYADMVFENDTEAEQWFHSYEGFADEEELDESFRGEPIKDGLLMLEESLGHSVKADCVQLHYEDLTIEVPYRHSYGARRNAYGDWEPDENTREISVSHTYCADHIDVEEVLDQLASDDEAFRGEHADIPEEDWDAFVSDYVTQHFDELLERYEDDVLEGFEEDATEDATEEHWSDLLYPEEDAFDAYKARRDEQAISENWCDDALAELSAKPRSQWTEDDWDTYNYCKNANAERDWQDAQDDGDSGDEFTDE